MYTKKTVVCKHCGKEFVRTNNSQKHCSPECRRKYYSQQFVKAKYNVKMYECHWCGIAFEAEQKRKYCTEECRKFANNRGRRKSKANVSLDKVIKLANEAGLTYGQYVAKYGL